MLLAEIVETSRRVTETSGRLLKRRLLADLLSRLTPAEIPIAISYLSGLLRQGRIGIGIAKLYSSHYPPAMVSTLTLCEVDAVFAELAAATGRGSARRREEVLTAMFERATAEEQQFLRRIVAGELRQGALEGIMVDAVAEASGVAADRLREALMLTGSLAEVAGVALAEGEGGVARFSVRLFTPVAPMLAQTAAGVDDALGRVGEASFEWKLDGARIQLHKEGDEVRLYTRNLNEVTDAIPELVEQAKGFSAQSLILDGEAIALHGDGSPYPFQATMSRFGRKLDVARQREILPLSAFYFDCLYLNGLSLLDRPQAERFEALIATLPAEVVVPRLVTGDPSQAASFLASVLEAGHEGVMAKSLVASYEAGRRGFGWLKIKPVKTLDLVVLAAEWGNGRRQGFLSNLHLGARDEEKGGFVMLGKTFKGMTDQMLSWQTAKFLELEDYRDRYTVYLRPELVVEIAFNDLQASPRYPGGLALRFARVKRYRPDKLPTQADTIATVRQLYALQQRSLFDAIHF